MRVDLAVITGSATLRGNELRFAAPETGYVLRTLPTNLERIFVISAIGREDEVTDVASRVFLDSPSGRYLPIGVRGGEEGWSTRTLDDGCCVARGLFRIVLPFRDEGTYTFSWAYGSESGSFPLRVDLVPLAGRSSAETPPRSSLRRRPSAGDAPRPVS